MQKKNESPALSFEQALAELETIVKRLEQGDTSLDESASLYESGMLLAEQCKQKLKNMEEKISQLQLSPEGEVQESKFEI